MKKTLLVLSLLVLGTIFAVTMSGCMFVTGREITVTPTIKPPTSSDTTAPVTEPVPPPGDTTPSPTEPEPSLTYTNPTATEPSLPLIDVVAHGPLETAYFALG